MRQWIRAHLTYANVMVTILAFIVLGGGTAVALNGTNTVQSDDLGPGAQVKAPDIADDSVRSVDVSHETLVGGDIKDQSGVDTCVESVRVGQLCVRVENFARPWIDASGHCGNLDLRLPSLSEAMELVRTHDILGVGEQEFFWTDEFVGSDAVWVINDSAGSTTFSAFGQTTAETVCVTTPTN
jgi:hypothetical protein